MKDSQTAGRANDPKRTAESGAGTEDPSGKAKDTARPPSHEDNHHAVLADINQDPKIEQDESEKK